MTSRALACRIPRKAGKKCKGLPEQAFFECASETSSCAAAGRRAAAVFDRLHDFEAFPETLVVHDLALTQKVKRFDDLTVVRHVHEVLVRRARFLLGCTLRCATFWSFPCIFSKIPVYFDQLFGCFGNAPADANIIDQRFYNRAVEALKRGIAVDQFFTMISFDRLLIQ